MTAAAAGYTHGIRVAMGRAAERDPSLIAVRVSPHTIRHTIAMHLLQSGVDLSVIAMWLGHESIQTTHQYLNADLDTKRRALEHLKAPSGRRTKKRERQPLLRFLQGL